MKAIVYNQKGTKVEDITLEDSIFGIKVNPKIISEYKYIYLSNQRQATANTKDRSEVRGGGKKPWRQKGTGRARVGSSRSPIWRKGGVVFGPTTDVNFKKKMTKNFRKAAMRNVLSLLAQKDLLKIVDELKIEEGKPSTKFGLDIIKGFENPKKITVITNDKKTEVIKSFDNIKNSNVQTVKNTNSYELFNGGVVLIEKAALDYINEYLK